MAWILMFDILALLGVLAYLLMQVRSLKARFARLQSRAMRDAFAEAAIKDAVAEVASSVEWGAHDRVAQRVHECLGRGRD